MIDYAKEAWAVAIERISSGESERERVIERLGRKEKS
jgi:hypothetical protein